jgi:hypothetical protein
MLWAFPARALGMGKIGYLVSGFFIILGYPLVLNLLRRRTRFWLTPRRLVWRTRRGQVRQLALDSLHYAFPLPFISVDGLIVREEDGPRALLTGMKNLQALRAILELRERTPLRGETLRAPTYALAMFPAKRREKAGLLKWLAHSGVVVMRPGQLVFLEDRHLRNMVWSLFGWLPGDFQGLSLSALMQQLQLLPEAEFDRCLERLAPTGGGSRWSSSAVTHGRTDSGEYHVLLPDGSVLTGAPEATQHEAIRRVLQLDKART